METGIELRHLRYFLAVAEDLHFGQAAKRLHIAQPPLSQQIRQLERMVGHALFVRTSRSVQLTPAGALLVERARLTLAKVQEDVEAVQRAGRGEDGTLTVGFVESAILSRLPAVLRRYRLVHPRVRLRLHEFHTRQLVDALRNGLVDVGLARDAEAEEWMQVEPVVIEPFIVVAPTGHRLARQETATWVELKNEPFVFFERSAGQQAWDRTIENCERHGFQPNIVQEAEQWLTVLRLVGAGLGVTVAPASVAGIAHADVVCRPLAPDGGATHLDLVYRRDTANPLVGGFRRLVLEGMAEPTGLNAEEIPPKA
ncbi:LysR substrate-binding domain-containing protein [uncultured Paludibaculum sp.]|uniref:LysR substrate-binding domain-containing protein n=1 Tax=uncultured Paludibaculum sp. TaxID=1765020 RepID=UPI002AAB0B00|nr:LysR substrate-binding domain-containing protein [uncultured Paludibaculum sp.]